MCQTPLASAQSLTVVEIDGLIAQAGYLESLPWVQHVDTASSGGLVVWLADPPTECAFTEGDPPERPPEVELHGQGAPCRALVGHPLAQHVEVFFDGLGDPEFAPRGWWHARVWLKAA